MPSDRKISTLATLVTHLTLLVLLAWAIPAAASAASPTTEAPREGVSLTIYSSADPAGFDPQRFIAQQRQGYDPQSASQVPGFGVVRDNRILDLDAGLNRVAFTDVAQFIDPTTVSLVDLSGARRPVEVVEQQFQFDLVSPQKLLDAYLDREITVLVPRGDTALPVTGTLLGTTQGRLVLQTPDGLRMVNGGNEIELGALPDGLLTRPTLVWKLWSPQAGRRPVRTAYQTEGLTWRSDYNLVLDPSDTHADLGAWVTLLNLSGTAYADARLKLIAGDVRRLAQYYSFDQLEEMEGITSMAAIRDTPEPFEEKSFFEYHLYTLPRPVTIHQNATQQLALFPTKTGVDVEKVLVYYGLPDQARYWLYSSPNADRNLGNQSSSKVDVYLRFDNEEANGLGLPLPAGKVRVYKADATGDGALEFVGEDVIGHTPKGNEVLIKIGQSFDVTGERTQTDFQVDHDGHWIEETVQIKVKNAKNVPQKVLVRETLYRWTNWTILHASHAHEKIDSRTIHFPVTVPAEGEETVTYTVRYTW